MVGIELGTNNYTLNYDYNVENTRIIGQTLKFQTMAS